MSKKEEINQEILDSKYDMLEDEGDTCAFTVDFFFFVILCILCPIALPFVLMYYVYKDEQIRKLNELKENGYIKYEDV